MATLADEENGRVLRQLHADVQVALAFSRATLVVMAELSPEVAATLDGALGSEASGAMRGAAPQRVLDQIESARLQILRVADQAETMCAMEYALAEAARRLPDFDATTPSLAANG